MEKKGKRAGRVPNGVEAAALPATAEAPEPPEAVAVTALPVAVRGGSPPPQNVDFPRDALAALAESQAVLARGLDAFSLEAAGLAHRGIDTVARSATEMLGVRTLADAIEVNAALMRRSFDALLADSTRLSELGVKLAADAAQPILAQFGRSWVRFARLYP